MLTSSPLKWERTTYFKEAEGLPDIGCINQDFAKLSVKHLVDKTELHVSSSFECLPMLSVTFLFNSTKYLVSVLVSMRFHCTTDI